ncbi:GNAT family N-acetyltransferase [Streptomyces armeniacus]|uniref:GNAT family N-acetyltransferase n=1 Tax=Streptomyces armeniacus TaxID=83291 RepID=A0A345XPF6_9ACTN|nr:GNAT family N-acetyltransferase [Streptomyces armeniacus]AXK33522.1 GNAT family N-acetyltransferase [Streptomyces armeniacus]
MSGDDIRVRPLAEADWDGVAALESRTYAGLGLSEGRAALESRGRVSPGTCFALVQGPRLAGYVLALPYPLFRYPDLERAEAAAVKSARPSNLHLHDLVVEQGLRHRGLGGRLLRHLTATARSCGYERISLLAVGGSEPFWSAQGFAVQEGVVPLGYGPGAAYMSRAVRAGGPDAGATRDGRAEPTGPPGGPSSRKETCC